MESNWVLHALQKGADLSHVAVIDIALPSPTLELPHFFLPGTIPQIGGEIGEIPITTLTSEVSLKRVIHRGAQDDGC